jgi:hypothetical protein
MGAILAVAAVPLCHGRVLLATCRRVKTVDGEPITGTPAPNRLTGYDVSDPGGGCGSRCPTPGSYSPLAATTTVRCGIPTTCTRAAEPLTAHYR